MSSSVSTRRPLPFSRASGVSRSPWRSLRHPSMRLWTAANVVSNAGTWMQMVAQNLLVLQLTGSVALTGLSLSAQAAPGIVFGVLGGAVADRFSLRRVAAVGQILLATIAFTTALLASLELITVAVVIGLGVLSGIVATADGPACALLGNELVPREDVASAIAVGSVAGNAGRLAGTALAGLTVAAFGTGTAYVANGVSFLVVAACVPFLRSAAGAVPDVDGADCGDRDDTDVRAGLRCLTRDRALLALLAVGLVTSLLGRNYTLSMAALVTGPLAGSAGDYGQVGTALAVGGILGGIVAGRLHRPAVATVLVLGGAAAGLQVAAGLSPVLLVVLVVAVPMAAAEGAMATAVQTMLQTLPPEGVRGRVLGAWRTVSTAWGLAGPLTVGALIELLGARTGLAVGGVLTVVLLAGVGLVSVRGRVGTGPTDLVSVRRARPVAVAA